MPPNNATDLSERVAELFVLTASLYFSGSPNPDPSASPRDVALHDAARFLLALNAPPAPGEAALLRGLVDGLRDAAAHAHGASRHDLATALYSRAEAVAGLIAGDNLDRSKG